MIPLSSWGKGVIEDTTCVGESNESENLGLGQILNGI